MHACASASQGGRGAPAKSLKPRTMAAAISQPGEHITVTGAKNHGHGCKGPHFHARRRRRRRTACRRCEAALPRRSTPLPQAMGDRMLRRCMCRECPPSPHEGAHGSPRGHGPSVGPCAAPWTPSRRRAAPPPERQLAGVWQDTAVRHGVKCAPATKSRPGTSHAS